jgi:hypothetical protein
VRTQTAGGFLRGLACDRVVVEQADRPVIIRPVTTALSVRPGAAIQFNIDIKSTMLVHFGSMMRMLHAIRLVR